MKNGYIFLENDKIKFFFDFSNCKIKKNSVFIAGTFNSWDFSCNPNWELSPENENLYVLTKDFESVNIPGNCGFPEFRFYVKNHNKKKVLKSQNKEIAFQDNNVIVKNPSDYETVKNLVEKLKIKKKKDFDLSNPSDREKISNIRLVPGTKCLYRGYHPYKKSRPELDTENIRIKLVQKFLADAKINCDITLCGKEKSVFWRGEKKCNSMKVIEKNNNRLWVDIEYNLVYYNSDSMEFALVLQEIARFIISRKGPFYLHCRLGSDRTGVISSVFASLAGASWSEIVIDYEKTANMGTGEVRNAKLLEYSLSKMIKKQPSTAENLSREFRSFFTEKALLSNEEIDKLIFVLKTSY